MSAEAFNAPVVRDTSDVRIPLTQIQDRDIFQDYRNGGRSDQAQARPAASDTAADRALVPQLALSQGQDTVYTVRQGDNLWNIARRHLAEQNNHATTGDAARPVTPKEISNLVRQIYEANKGNGRDQISNPNRIYPNQHLIIPGAGHDSNSRQAARNSRAGAAPASERVRPTRRPDAPANRRASADAPIARADARAAGAEAPVRAGEAPAAATDAPVRAAETPAAGADAPVRAAEAPATPVETPRTAETNPEPVENTGRQGDVPAVEAPAVPVDSPDTRVEDPQARVDNPQERVDAPAALPHNRFTPQPGTPDNPTVGAEVAAREAETMLRYFDRIPANGHPGYVDSASLNQFLQTATDLPNDDKRWLASAATHINRIQLSSNDEWGRENSGATKADLTAYPDQEKAFEEQFTARAYLKNNFDQIRGTDTTVNIDSMRAWGQRRAAADASAEELKIIGDAERMMTRARVSQSNRGVQRNMVDAVLAPRVTVGNSTYQYRAFTR